MFQTIESHLARATRVACAALMAATTLMVLAGWVAGNARLRNGLIGAEPVRPMTAVALFFAGLALMARKRRLVFVLSTVPFALGTLGLLEWTLGIDMHVDELLFRGHGIDMRMSLRAAAASMLMGAAGMAGHRTPTGRALAAGVAFIGLLSLVVFAYGGHFLPGTRYTQLAPATAFLVLAWALATVVDQERVVTFDLQGLLTLFTPIVFGALCLWAAVPPYFDARFAVALLATCTGFTLLLISRAMTSRLRRMERMYRSIVEMTQEGICTVDAEQRFTFVNDRLAAMLGFTPAELLGRDAKAFVAPEDRAGVAQRQEARAAGVSATQADLQLLRRDGTRIRVISSTTTMRARNGSVSALLSTFTDITERARVEQALRESEQQFRSLYEADIIGVAYFTVDGRVQQANGELLRIFGIERNQLPEWRWNESGSAETQEADAHALAELEATGRFHPYERLSRRPDGTQVWVLITGARLSDGGGIAFVIDITERVEARQALERAYVILGSRVAQLEGEVALAPSHDDVARQRVELETLAARLVAANEELETFSYSVSHDLRTPLRGVDGFSRELLLGYSQQLDARGRNYLERIRAATQRMSRLIDDLLNLSRLSRRTVRRETVDLSALAHEITADLPIRACIAPGLTAFADPHLVRIMLENIVGNAVKFSARAAEPRVEVFSPAAGEFAVRDNGTGFDMQYVDKIFAPFQRLHTSEYEGTGIGLAIVQRIVHRHGGFIRAESAPDRGATFFFTFGGVPQ